MKINKMVHSQSFSTNSSLEGASDIRKVVFQPSLKVRILDELLKPLKVEVKGVLKGKALEDDLMDKRIKTYHQSIQVLPDISVPVSQHKINAVLLDVSHNLQRIYENLPMVREAVVAYLRQILPDKKVITGYFLGLEKDDSDVEIRPTYLQEDITQRMDSSYQFIAKKMMQAFLCVWQGKKLEHMKVAKNIKSHAGSRKVTQTIFNTGKAELMVEKVEYVRKKKLRDISFLVFLQTKKDEEKFVGVPLFEERAIAGRVDKRLMGFILLSNQVSGGYSEESDRQLDILRRYGKIASATLFDSSEYNRLCREDQHDGATSLFSYSYSDKILRDAINHAGEYGEKLSVLMIDIDNFSKMKSKHNFVVADGNFRIIADILRKKTRNELAYACRYSGGSFLVILPQKDAKEAAEYAENLRQLLKKGDYKGKDRKTSIPMTVSIGISEYGSDAYSPRLLLEKAEEALLKAKRKGKDRIEVASEEEVKKEKKETNV